MAYWAMPLLFLVVLSGCRKPEDDLGLDLLPGDPLGTVVELPQLKAYTFRDTAVRTSGASRQLLGSYVDPQFGLVQAGIVTQIRLSANNIGSGLITAGFVADSLVLALAFDGINYGFGNLNPQVFRVYEITENLSLDSSYHSDRVPQFDPMDIAANRGGRITPKPLTSPVIGGDSLAPQLRIRLDQSIAERFLAAFNTDDFADNTQFLEFFKGVYVTVDNGPQAPFQGGILYFNLIAAASQATLYYHDLNATDPTATVKLDFLINSNCARYTVVRHDHSLAMDQSLSQALSDNTAPAPLTFVQTLGGLRTAFRMPLLMDFATPDKILSKAELIVPVNGTYYPFYPPPAQFFLFRKDTTGKDAFLPDQLSGIGAIDGTYRSTNREYRFNITRYVQQILNGRLPNTGFEIVSGSNGVTANRVVLNGPDAAENPARLRLTFTTY